MVPEGSRVLGMPVVIVKMGDVLVNPEPAEEASPSPVKNLGKDTAGEWEHDVVACMYLTP